MQDEVVYRFELPDEMRLTWAVQFGRVVPTQGETVVIPGVPGVFEVAEFIWRLPRHNDGPRQPVVCAIVVQKCAVQPQASENDPFDGDPDGGDPRDRR
jgi:hypothetical protein